MIEIIILGGFMKKLNSKDLIGNPKLRFKELSHKKWEWRSFYNGWIEWL